MLDFLAWDSVRSFLDVGLGGVALMLYARQGKILDRLYKVQVSHGRRLTLLERVFSGRPRRKRHR